jgi:allantoicase
MDSASDPEAWLPLLPATRLQPDTQHRFRLAADRPVTHVRIDIVPDGGLARLRLYGNLTAAGLDRAVRRWSESLPPAQAQAVLREAGAADLAALRATIVERP